MHELPAVNAKYLPFWTEGTVAVCVKDSPRMKGFGRQLKKGDEVVVKGVCWDPLGFYELSIPDECAFYEMEGFFEPKEEPCGT